MIVVDYEVGAQVIHSQLVLPLCRMPAAPGRRISQVSKRASSELRSAEA